MTVHAFVEESRRNSTYYITAVIVDPSQLASTRKAMRAMVFAGQREIHFHNEKPPRRRVIADAVARLPVEVHIYHCQCERRDESASQACLAQLVKDLLSRQAHRLVLESRTHRDVLDRAILRSLLGKGQQESGLVYEHINSQHDPLLWIAEVAGWCCGIGGDWRTRIKPIIGAVHDLGLA